MRSDVRMGENLISTDSNKSLFRPDEPVKNVDEDRFYHKHFVDVLKHIICNCDAPLNIALYGRWGVGKSSILNFFGEGIKTDEDLNKKFKFVVIDVWKFSPHILKQEFLDALNRELGTLTDEKIEEKLWYHREKDSTISSKILLRSKYAWMWVAIPPIIVATMLGLGHFGNSVMLTSSSFLASITPALLVLTSTLREISKSMTKSGRIIIPRIESYAQFKDLFDYIIKKNKSKNREKMIIAIDNLDRCDDESVVSILNMIKTFLSDPECIFIVSCDQDAIIKHLQRKKGQFDEKRDAKEFLAKFFQVSLYIPNQIKGQLHSYAKSHLEIFGSDIEQLDPNVADVFVNAITKNPRKIRQFVYNFVIAYKMAAMKEGKGNMTSIVTKNTSFLAKITVLREEWPDFFSMLEKKPTLLDAIQKFIDTGSSSEHETDNLQNILKNNEGLEYFLKSTSTAKSIQVLPFIQLDQELFESTLPELENMTASVNRNDVESVKEILRKYPGKQYQYVQKLCRLTEQYIEYDRTMVASNVLNVLISTYNTMENRSKEEIVKLLNTFMGGGEVLNSLMMFDIDILFSITFLLVSDTKEAVHSKYAKNLSMPNYAIPIIKKFRDNPTSISDSVCQTSDKNLRLLGQSNKELFHDAVTLLAENDMTAAKFVKEHTLNEIIGNVHPSTSDKWMKMYMMLKHLANKNNKQTFVKNVLSPIKTDKGKNMPPDHMKIYEVFRDFASGDFAGSAAKYTYDSLKEPAMHYADAAERATPVEIILKTYAGLDYSDREEFATDIFAPLITKIAPQQISSIVEIIRNENIQILNFDSVADVVFSMLQSNPTHELITLMYVGIPNNKWADYEDRIIQIHIADANRVKIFSSAFNLSDRAPRELRTKIFEHILQSCKQLEHDKKLSIYQDLVGAIDVLDKPSINTLTDELLSELKPNDDVQIDSCLELINGCFDKTTKTKQREGISSLLTKLKECPPSKTNLMIGILRFLISKTKDMVQDEKDRLAGFAIETLANADSPTVAIMEILGQFNGIEFGKKRKSAYDLVGKLCESPNVDIKSKAQEIRKGLDPT